MSTTLTYGLLLEVAPGVLRPAILCNTEDLARARALEALRGTIRHELASLIHGAMDWNLEIPCALRERVALWAGGVDEGQQLVQELRDALFAV